MHAAKDRLIQTFKFLKELNELRNPVPRDLSHSLQKFWLDEWPEHPCINIRRGDRTEEEGDESGEEEPEPIIRVRRVDLTACPTPPAPLDGWLKSGWQTVDGHCEVLQARNFADKNDGAVTVAFGDEAARVTAFKTWSTARAKWVEAEQPAILARKVFENIHGLWTSMQRESDTTELVLGDGILNVPKESISHPVLLQRINLQFDAAGPEFRFYTGTDKTELHRALLRLVPAIEGRAIAQFDRELEALPVEPLGGESATAFLRRLVQGLFATDGTLLDRDTEASDNRPTVRRRPVIFVRSRNAGLTTTLDHIVEDLEQNEGPAPEGLARIVGVEAAAPRSAAVQSIGMGDPQHPTTEDPDILFSKPANAEQYQIASRLSKAQAVLVQGPPGTGKTHTIANLLGCLLAQGKTVLVTAHTTKALRVLRKQVDDVLKSLCLSVLDSDSDSQEQLKLSAREISSRLSASHAPNLRREAALLREKRKKLLDTEASLLRRLRDARFSEVEELVIGGEALHPIEVAKRVKADAKLHAWIPSGVVPNILCPLSDDEIRQLYATNVELTRWDEAQLSIQQPLLAELVAPADFRLRATERAAEGERAQAHRAELWADAAGRKVTAAELEALHRRVEAMRATLEEKEVWLREVLFAGWSGGDLRETWRELLSAIERLVADAGAALRLIADHGAELPREISAEQIVKTLDEISDYFQAGGLLGLKTKLTKRHWHTLLEVSQIDFKAPMFEERCRALRAGAQLKMDRIRLIRRWHRLVGPYSGPAIDTGGTAPERTANGYTSFICARLDWRAQVWEPTIKELSGAGFCWDKWLVEHPPVSGDHGELARLERAVSDRLTEVIYAQVARTRQEELTAALSTQRTYLAGFPQSEIAGVLLEAQDKWDTAAYEEACQELGRLEGLRNAYQSRVDLLSRLKTAASEWARCISRRDGIHANSMPPGDSVAAWRWRQWHDELERRASISLVDLQERLHSTRTELREVAATIIELETWASQRERTSLDSQLALTGYVQTIRKIGKGTGKRVPDLLREARALLAKARRAVPVWIMPLSRVYESFDPRETKFDVVIIDEASQSDVTALAALYFGHEHVVVGDNEQVTPDDVGQRLDQVQRLIDTNLQGIPNNHLYDGQTSIYDLAEAAFGGVVALREHFRCVPEIIQFSNHLSYNLQIRPLREPNSASVRPAVISHRVFGFRQGKNKTNTVEAVEIASLVVACISDPAYAANEQGEPTSFGVISLLGDEQALLIEEMLRLRLDPVVFAKHRLLCGNAAQFQGDERDVMFLSMVDGPPEDGQLTLRDEGPKGMYKKRYNVAVSRARNQLWVVHSLDPSVHLKPRDLRRRLIEHARDPQMLMRAMDVDGKRTESPFEKAVLQRLMAVGYQVRTQWSVGAYRIDLVVQGRNGQRLAVECDGERWHTPDQIQTDIERQTVLERLGWRFVRIRGSLFFRDPDAAMGPVFVTLDQLGIEPFGSSAEPAESDVVIDRIRRSAEILRQQWEGSTRAEESVIEPVAAAPEPQGAGVRSRAGTPRPASLFSEPIRDSSEVKATAKSHGRSPDQTPQHLNVLDELSKVNPKLHNPRCACGRTARLEIAEEGIVVHCANCKDRKRVDTDTLQRLADEIGATCFACNGTDLKSTARPYGNILMCMIPTCGTKNTWRGVSDRL